MTENVPAIQGVIVRRVELPSGGYAEFRDPEELRAKDQRRVIDNIRPGNNDRPLSMTMDVREGTVCMLVEAWSVPYLPNAPLPRDLPDILGELKPGDYGALLAAADPAVAILFPSAATPDDAGKPGSPTLPASA